MGDVTITAEREEIVDFSIPIDTSDLIFIKKKTEFLQSNKFSFLLPLSTEVWISILASLLIGEIEIKFMLLLGQAQVRSTKTLTLLEKSSHLPTQP